MSTEDFFTETDNLLDDWFYEGRFTGFTPQGAVARMLQAEYPHLSLQGAKNIVKVWFDCARDMGEID